jgi:guanosine-3',5'-bis(diphosphate) 3'-pyrophosphohydrolase
MSRVQEIYHLMKYKPSEEGAILIQKAYDFAEKAHETQKRASGEPYFNHVLETAKHLASFGMDATVISAGLLHDTIEDTPVTEQELWEQFGTEIVYLVNGVTKLGHLKYTGQTRHVESLRKFFVASAEDVRVIIIKLADRLHNAQTLEFVKPEKAKRIALETIEIHASLAYRLGMRKLTGELEDAAFPFAYPKEHQIVEKLLKQRKESDKKYLEKVYKSLKKEMAENKVRDIATDYRVKRKYSLWRKLQRKEMDIEKIYDIVALRVIVSNIEDCYRLLGIVHNMWRPLPGRIKDYIALPKPNGYQSIHTTIFTGDGGIAEIQIRTQEMHDQAEYGIASHLMYKEGQKSEALKKSMKNIAWLEDLKEIQKEEIDGDKFLANLKTDFFEDRIFILTPKGDVIDLPKGSSVIDFAFNVHTEIGLHANGARVNGKYSSLKTILENGDIVTVEINKDSKPSAKWLDHCKTALAQKQIKSYLKENGTQFEKWWSN